MNDIAKNIRAKVIDLASSSRIIRNQINQLKREPDSGPARSGLWQDKRDIGAETRVWLLAYACVRGMPYQVVESKCRDGNKPSPSHVLSCIAAALPENCPEVGSWTKDRIKAWLAAATSPQTASAAREASAPQSQTMDVSMGQPDGKEAA